MSIDIAAANQQLAGKPAQDIVAWAMEQGDKPLVTTNFGPYEAVILHMCVQVKADLPVVWMDSGYATEATYRFAREMMDRFNLNMHIYAPQQTRAWRDFCFNGIPEVDTDAHDAFTEQVKLEPFRRAMAEMAPDVWFTAIRREQTAFRAGLQPLSQNPGEPLKVAPLLDWKAPQLDAYLAEHGLRNEEDYYDPTKVLGNRECGLHTTADGRLVRAATA